MTNTSLYPYTVDGVRLDTYAWNIRSMTGRDMAAALKTPNLDSPMMHGEVWTPGKKYGPGRNILKMWVQGCDADGNVQTDSYWKYRENLDALRIMFGVRHRQLDVQQTLRVSPAVVRKALCEVSAMIDPEQVARPARTAEFTVELTIPDAFWSSLGDANWDSGTGIVSAAVQELTQFAGITAPMEEMYLVVDGPAVNPQWNDYPSSHWVRLERSLLSTEQWVVNTRTWSSKIGAKSPGIAFTDDGADVRSQTSYGGYHVPRMFGITPKLPNPQVQLVGTSFTSATRGRIRGPLKYL